MASLCAYGPLQYSAKNIARKINTPQPRATRWIAFHAADSTSSEIEAYKYTGPNNIHASKSFQERSFNVLATLLHPEGSTTASIRKAERFIRNMEFLGSIGIQDPKIAEASDMGVVFYWKNDSGLLRVHIPAEDDEDEYAYWSSTKDGPRIIEPLDIAELRVLLLNFPSN